MPQTPTTHATAPETKQGSLQKIEITVVPHGSVPAFTLVDRMTEELWTTMRALNAGTSPLIDDDTREMKDWGRFAQKLHRIIEDRDFALLENTPHSIAFEFRDVREADVEPFARLVHQAVSHAVDIGPQATVKRFRVVFDEDTILVKKSDAPRPKAPR